jgi:cyclic dehypoxanthinyl futalosine synthase
MILDSLVSMLRDAENGIRVMPERAVRLFDAAPLIELGAVADRVRLRLHPKPFVTYVVDRNINYTNVCVSRCRFCAFAREDGHREAYVLGEGELFAKIGELLLAGGTQVLLQGGLHPGLKLDFYEGMLRAIRSKFPGLHLHAFSPPEIVHFSRLNRTTPRDVLQRLRDAGLATIPGGGAEILVDRVRSEMSPCKCTATEWLDVMRQAHVLGMKTTATMVFGMTETIAERVEHLARLRALQDETGGFTAFICWSFQPGNTGLDRFSAGGHDYLRTLAMARIFLDNFHNVQASWVTPRSPCGSGRTTSAARCSRRTWCAPPVASTDLRWLSWRKSRAARV